MTTSNYEKIQNVFSKKHESTVYSLGWIACFLLGLNPDVDTEACIFVSPTYPNNFPIFWRDFISLMAGDRSLVLSDYYLKKKIQEEIPFKKEDFEYSLNKLLNHSDYKIVKEIRVGGESIIYLVENKATGENHAIKKMKKEISLIDVIKTIHAIDHYEVSSYVIKYIGISKNKNEFFIHMEYASNGSLREMISLDNAMKAPSWFNELEKLRIANEIAKGMESLHSQDIIHGDLKPDNILLDSENKVKICDYSLITGNGVRTMCFMAPEVSKKTPYN